MQYLVTGSGGPGFATPDETLAVLEKGILPTFEHLLQLEADGVIVAGGLPVGDRSFVFIIEADSNDALDRTLRDISPPGVCCSGRSRRCRASPLGPRRSAPSSSRDARSDDAGG